MSLGMLVRPPMAKRGRPKTGTDNVSAKIDRRLKSMADVIAGRRGVDTSAILNELLEGPLDRAYLDIMRELERRKPKGGE